MFKVLVSKRLMVVLVVLALLGLVVPSAQAVLLVNPDGSPVGGKWQRWADRARVPTYSGGVVLTHEEGRCGGSDLAACVIVHPPDAPIIIVPAENAVSERTDLYHELGHLYDWQHLQPTNRRVLTDLLGDLGKTWDEYGDPSGGTQDDFAYAYVICALDYRKRHALAEDAPIFLFHLGRQRQVCRIIAATRHQSGVMPETANLP